MTPDEKTSDLVMKRDQCPVCGAVWLNNRHVWSTGNKGDELDLAGLVCNPTDSKDCINPKKGLTGGDTWKDRMEFINAKYKEEMEKQE